MYKYVLNCGVKISMMFAKYFQYYTIIYLGVAFFVDTLYCPTPVSFFETQCSCKRTTVQFIVLVCYTCMTTFSC